MPFGARGLEGAAHERFAEPLPLKVVGDDHGERRGAAVVLADHAADAADDRTRRPDHRFRRRGPVRDRSR